MRASGRSDLSRRACLARCVDQHAEVLPLFPGYPLAFLACLRERDGDCLFAAFHPTASSTFATFRFAPLVTVHLAFHLLAGTSRVFPLPFLSHNSLLRKLLST